MQYSEIRHIIVTHANMHKQLNAIISSEAKTPLAVSNNRNITICRAVHFPFTWNNSNTIA